LSNGCDLRDCSLHVRARPEENFNDAQSIHGLRLHVLNVVNGGGDAALGVGHDAVGHVLRRHARVEPYDRNHGNVDAGEDIGGRPKDRDRRENDDDERHHDECIRTP
jgi:hypothetical protein